MSIRRSATRKFATSPDEAFQNITRFVTKNNKTRNSYTGLLKYSNIYKIVNYLSRHRLINYNYRHVSLAAKRSIDIVSSTVLILLMAPIISFIVLLIYLTMGRPILFSHERIGFKGSTFKCYKFRTMGNDASERLVAHLRDNPAAAAEWKSFHKLKDDPRVTPLGGLLRKSSLDELPQLFNILRGDMSCVGPRPVTAEELSRYKNSARHYLRVRPGLTGLWQVSGRSNAAYAYRVALDRTYVANWAMWLDIKILMKTLPAVFRFHESA